MLLKYVFNSFISSDKQKLMSYILNVTQIRNEIQKYKKATFRIRYSASPVCNFCQDCTAFEQLYQLTPMGPARQ